MQNVSAENLLLGTILEQKPLPGGADRMCVLLCEQYSKQHHFLGEESGFQWV